MATDEAVVRRVLFVNSTDGFGGGEFYARDLARALETVGIDTHTFIAGERPELWENLESYGLSATLSGIPLRVSRPLLVYRSARALGKTVRAFRPDVLVSNLPRSVLLSRLVASRGARQVALLHSPLGSDAISRAARPFARRILTNTDHNGTLLGGRSAVKSLRVLTPIADVERQSEPPRRDLVTMVGRFQAYKGHLDFVELAARIHKSHPNLRYRIFGSVSDESQTTHLADVRRRIEERGMSSLVEVHVGADTARIHESLAHSVVYVHPAKFEDFGISVIEALANGCAVVAYAAEGPRTILRDVPSCRVVAVTDVEALVAATEELLGLAELSGNELRRQSVSASEPHLFGARYAERARDAVAALSGRGA